MGSRTLMENHCSTEAPILASSDIHSPLYLSLFRKSLDNINSDSCIFILAGDIVDKGVVAAAEPVFRSIRQKNNFRIISVFGNEEYIDREGEFKRKYSDIVWLNDDYVIVELNEKSVAIIGTRGALGRLTKWQRRHMPWLEEVYNKRPEVIRDLISKAKKEADIVIVVSHYALTHFTIIGEPRHIWPEVYSPRMEKVILEEKPHIVVHGHAHSGRPFANIKGIRIYNVALPLNKRIIPIYIKGEKPSLMDWILGR